ncbi:cGMP-dependent protein kinase, isozyme 1-like isoform X1 [Schistocerca nitens]|uniref:cGMP-dependent protein kinase, isozyme 1-like isoform X1 n=2 Tax=Schistocerca nitens TaxID=7011 RepID=UPI002119858F|nr:cGMP-dependent protein kinase, isozyme 1-like isoform X1 [Schistocerca nitens]XP_049806722.1 cGMP-dependent protein kinase, isozyme 1-like isoform X1 [Schistocerca nitens]
MPSCCGLCANMTLTCYPFHWGAKAAYPVTPTKRSRTPPGKVSNGSYTGFPEASAQRPTTRRTSNNGPKGGVLADPIPDADKAKDIKTPHISKDLESLQLIIRALKANEFLCNLNEVQMQAVAEAMSLQVLDSSGFVIEEGEIGRHLYVSAAGRFEVIKGGKSLGTFGPGTAFGEIAILYNTKRQASIKADEGASVWVLDRRIFKQIMMRTGLQKTEDNIKFLRTVPILEGLSERALAAISELVRVEFFAPNTVIVRQGDEGDTFYIISGGNVQCSKKTSSGVEEKLAVLGTGEYFGELALLHSIVRQATVTALHPGVECLVLERGPFIQFLGDLDDLKKSYGGPEPPRPSATAVPTIEHEDLKLSDLEEIATLGVGGFGRVELVVSRTNKNLVFALKKLKKSYVVEQQQEQHAYNEKNVMLRCKDCPFISRLYRTYRDSRYVYFLMEPCLGGDVFSLLQRRHLFDEKTARFMTACVVEALDYLHTRGFIYRDLKPENLLLDSKGYIKMVDFGFAKEVGPGGKTWTFAGTPEYVAPEIILNLGHNRAVDYWALGIFMHELLTGRPPFRGSDHLKTYNMILKGIGAVTFPKYMSKYAQNMIRHLCQHHAAERLGYQKAGIKDIKDHKWFHGFDWEALRKGTMRAPIIPVIKGPTDTSNFDKYPKTKDNAPDEFSGWDKDF